jgi:hypothetical protein
VGVPRHGCHPFSPFDDGKTSRRLFKTTGPPQLEAFFTAISLFFKKARMRKMELSYKAVYY